MFVSLQQIVSYIEILRSAFKQQEAYQRGKSATVKSMQLQRFKHFLAKF